MKLERKLLQKEKRDDKYYNDDTVGMKYNESHFKKVALIAGATLSIGYGYKHGAFKNTASNVMKYVSKYSTNIPATGKAFREWINDTAKQSLKKDYKKSFFRQQDLEKIKVSDLARKGDRQEFYKKVQDNLNKTFDKDRMKDTMSDLAHLKNKIAEEKHAFSSMRETQFMDDILDIRKNIRKLSIDGIKKDKNFDKLENAKNLWFGGMIERMSVDSKTQSKMIKRNNHRYAVLGDIFEITDRIDKNGNKVLNKKGQVEKIISRKNNQIKIDGNTEKYITKGLIKETFLDKDGKIKRLVDDKRFLNMKIDNRILLDKDGNITDLRAFSESTKLFANSLAKDFKIPVIDINPFKIFGFNEFGVKKVNNAVLNKDSIQTALTGQVGKNAAIKETMIFSNGSVYKYLNDGSLEKIKDNMHIKRVTKDSTYIDRELEAIRKMAGLKKAEHEEYTSSDGEIKNTIGKVFKKIDLGFDDIDKEDYASFGSGSMLNPNTWVEKVQNKLNEKGSLKPHKGIKKKNRYSEIFSSVDNSLEDIDIALNDSKKIKDIFLSDDKISFNKEKADEFFSQFFAGRNNLDEVTKATTIPFFLVDRVNSSLSIAGLGLGVDSETSTIGIMKNLMLKRVLPVYLGYNAVQYGIHLTEFGEDEENGGKHNIKKALATEIAETKLAYHKLKDSLGITNMAKYISASLPGIDQIAEIPGINALRLDTSFEEQLEYYKTGMDAIRKSRYWDGGTTAFTGCLTPNSQLITQDGLKFVKDITTDDLLIAKDGLYHKILASKIRKANETIYRLRTKFDYENNVWLTGNHNIYVIEKHHCSYNKNSICSPSKKNKKCVNCEYKHYEEYKPKWTPIEKVNKDVHMATMVVQKPTFFSDRINVNDILKNNNNMKPTNNTSNSEYILLNKDFGYLLGYYTANGYINNNTIKIIFKEEDKEYIEHTIELFNTTLGIKANKYYNKCTKKYAVVAYDHNIVEMFKALIHSKDIKHNKKLSKYLMDIDSKEMWAGLLSSFIKVKGVRSKQRIYIQLSSYEMVKNIQAILLRFKILSSISSTAIKLKNKSFKVYRLDVSGYECLKLEDVIDNKSSNEYLNNTNRTTKPKHSSIGFFITEDIVALNINAMDTKEFDGNVYDFEVEDECSFTNGFIMHNSKISYYRPNWYRRAMADVDFSDSKWGSRDEYFSNFALPTPTHLLSPIKHFITDPYHYDIKHYKDRPYLETSPMFSNVPIVGGLLSSSVGSIIKPVRKMHTDYWNSDMYNVTTSFNNSVNSLVSITNSSTRDLINQNTVSTLNGVSLGTIGVNESSGLIPFMYSSSGGISSLIGVNTDSIEIANENLNKGVSLKKQGFIVNEDTKTIGDLNDTPTLTSDEDFYSQSGLIHGVGEFYNSMNEYLGLYGFLNSAVMGSANENKKFIENSSYSNSISRNFWNMEIGGLGGEANEIFRRFLRKRLDDEQLINPVRNTMPNWLPGDDYFINFKVGDAYVKIANGEERLPGEGYERLWHIKQKDLYGVNSSHLYNVQELVDNIINKDLDLKTNHSMQNAALERTKNTIKTQWLNSGLAIDVDGEIEDDKNGITSSYDARVKDNSSKTGQAIVNINVVDDLKNVSKQERDRDYAELQYQMYATGVDKGYIQYVDSEDTTKRMVYDYDYNFIPAEMVLKNLAKARNIVDKKISSGEINRGDLYSPIDKFRILGDVAPYSDEFEAMSSFLSTIKLSEDEQQEVNAIRKRVQEQRKPKRLYEYQYKNQSLKTQAAIIDSVFDDKTFTIVGYDKALKLAGLDLVKEQEYEYVQDKQNQYIDNVLRPGSLIEISYDENIATKEKGTYVKAIVKKNGENFNKELLRLGYATENDSDGVADMFVKTDAIQRFAGSLWENIAHSDMPFFSNRYLRVRSSVEDYERSRVYGKEFSTWNEPIKDYLKPYLIDRNIEKGFINGIVVGTMVGTAFGKTRYGKVIAGSIAAMTITGGKFIAYGKEVSTGTKWRPKRVEKEQEINEYIDTLKYVKYTKLYKEYANKAKEGKNGIDVEKLLYEEENRGKKNKNKLNKLNSLKVKANKSIFSKRVIAFKQGVDYDLINPLTNIQRGLENIYTTKKGLKDIINNKLINMEKGKQDLSNVEGKKVYSMEDDFNSFKNELKRIKEQRITQYDKRISAKKKKIQNDKKIIPLFNKDNKKENKEKIEQLQKLAIIQNSIKNVGRHINDEELIAQVKDAGIDIETNKNKAIDRDYVLKIVNERIDKYTKELNINENAVKAIMYYKLSKQTMYAYEPGDAIADLVKAMPKKDRDYFRAFMEANNNEKIKILELAPKYMRRPLESAWGLSIEKKTDLESYFSQRALPDEDWIGWAEETNLDAVKTKMIKKEGLEFRDNNIWESDIDLANASGKIAIPKLNNNSNIDDTRNTLKNLLTIDGYKDIQITSNPSALDNDIQLYLTKDEKKQYKKELKDKIKEYL